MSLAQRRSAPEGIDTVQESSFYESRNSHVSGDNSNDDERRGSYSSQDTAIPVTKNDEIWQTLSYDPFAQKPLQHYESFPPEITENKAAYEVSTTKRAGKSSDPSPSFVEETSLKPHADATEQPKSPWPCSAAS